MRRDARRLRRISDRPGQLLERVDKTSMDLAEMRRDRLERRRKEIIELGIMNKGYDDFLLTVGG